MLMIYLEHKSIEVPNPTERQPSGIIRINCSVQAWSPDYESDDERDLPAIIRRQLSCPDLDDWDGIQVFETMNAASAPRVFRRAIELVDMFDDEEAAGAAVYVKDLHTDMVR